MQRFIIWLKNAYFDLLFLGLLLWLFWKIRVLVVQSPSNLTNWLLVYLTAIYAAITLYLALVSARAALAAERSAAATERSAKAMEDSIEEARMTRWAQFAASIKFADGETYVENADGSITLEFLNVFRQPIVNLEVAMWRTEIGSNNEQEVRYSTMMQSQPRNVVADEENITVVLQDSGLPESDRRAIGEMTLNNFKNVYNRMPQHMLCVVTYNDRVAILSPMVWIYDLRPKS